MMKVRAGIEMALIDAVAKSIGIPLWRLFGGFSNSITTDITVYILLHSTLNTSVPFIFESWLK